MEFEKGEIVYYIRYVPNCNIEEILELRVRTVENDWCVGVETNSHVSILFYGKDVNVTVFKYRQMALEMLKEIKLQENE